MADQDRMYQHMQQDKIEEQTHSTHDQSNDPPTDNKELAKLIATLDIEKRNAITEFVEVTKEHANVAIHTLKRCDWDLLEAVGKFFSGDQEDIVDDPVPKNESIRTSKQSKTRRFKARETPLRHKTLNRATTMNGKESPRNSRAAIFDPIVLKYTPSLITTPSVPMFKSPYPEKNVVYGFHETLGEFQRRSLRSVDKRASFQSVRSASNELVIRRVFRYDNHSHAEEHRPICRGLPGRRSPGRCDGDGHASGDSEF